MNTLAMNGVDLGNIGDGGDLVIAIVGASVFLIVVVVVSTLTKSIAAGMFSGVMGAFFGIMITGLMTLSSTASAQETAISDLESHYGVKLMSDEENGDILPLSSSDDVFNENGGYKRVVFEESSSLYEGYIVFVEEDEGTGDKTFALAVDTSEEGRELVEYDSDADMETQEPSRELEEAEASA